MAEDGRIIYKVLADTEGFSEKVAGAGKEGGGKLSEVMTGAARAIGEAFVNMAGHAISGIEQIVKAGVEFNAKMETYKTAFTTLTGSAEEADRIMTNIRADAAATPFDVDSLTQANQLLVAAGVDADAARSDVMNLANAIAATGGGSAELSRMAANMQQIKNVGKATAMDIRQFANAGINIYKLLADAQGISVEKASELEVTYEMLSDAMAKAAESGGIYEGALENQAQTFNGRMSTMKDNWQQLTGVLTEDLFATLSDTGLPMVMDWVATLLDAAETGGVSGAIHAAHNIFQNLLTSIQERAPEMAEQGVQLLIRLLEGITGGTTNVIDTIKAVVVAIGNALISHGPELLQAGFNLLVTIGEGILNAIPDILGIMIDLCSQLIETAMTTDWGSVGHHLVEGIKAGVIQWWDNLTSTLTEKLENLKSWAKRLLGISSPSKVFREYGRQVDEGMMLGLEDEAPDMYRTIHNVYEPITGVAEDAITTSDIERNISYKLSLLGSTGGTQITVPVNLDGREIARATAWSMGEQLAWEEL